MESKIAEVLYPIDVQVALQPSGRIGAPRTEARCERAFLRATDLLQQGTEALLDKPRACHSIP